MQQLGTIAILLGADADDFAEAEPIKLGRLWIERLGIALIGHAHNRLLDVAQPLGDFFIQSENAGPPINDKENDLGLIDGHRDLPFDVFGQIVHVGDADAAGIHQFDVARIDGYKRGNAVAGHAGGRIDDGDAPARQPVEQRGFAHIRAANDRYYR